MNGGRMRKAVVPSPSTKSRPPSAGTGRRPGLAVMSKENDVAVPGPASVMFSLTPSASARYSRDTPRKTPS